MSGDGHCRGCTGMYKGVRGVRVCDNPAPTAPQNTRENRKICFAGEGSARGSQKAYSLVHPVHPCRLQRGTFQLRAKTMSARG